MRATLVAAALLAAIPCLAQTSAELLQKGIYEQETAGNLDNAILIYRQIVNSAPSQRDVAAQAQYRLAQALLRKGDLTEASREFEKLARDYADYSNLVSSLAGQIRSGGPGPATPELVAARKARLQELQAKLAELRTKYTDGHPEVVQAERQIQDLQKGLELAAAGGAMTIPAAEFDPSKPITLTGKVSQVQWMNPQAWMKVENGGGTYNVQLASPNQMVRGGMTRNSIQLGMEVNISGILAKDGSMTAQANNVSSEGKVVFDRATLPSVPNAP